MTGTYDPDRGLPLDDIRRRLGDRGPDFLLSDSEINAALRSGMPTNEVAGELAMTLAAHFAGKAISTEVGPVKKQYESQSTFYRNLAQDCRQNSSTATVSAAVGEMSNPDLSEFIDLPRDARREAPYPHYL